MEMELGEHSRKFLLRVDQIVKELERVDRPVDPKDIDIVILSGLTPQYDAEFCMLESSSDWPTREWIERAVMNQYGQLECEKSAAGSRSMLSARGHRRNDKPPIRCPLCSRTGHSALKSREFQITRRVIRSRTDIRGIENKAAEAAKASEWAAIVQAEAIKTASGAEVMSTQTLGLGRSSPQALARL